MTTLFVDGDASPVKDEVYRVAERYSLRVYVVANAWIRTPRDPRITLIVVEQEPDAADDWIAQRASTGDVVVTADVPLADRTLKSGAHALRPNGHPFTLDNIGGALTSRSVGEHLRSFGVTTGGPKPLVPADRSRFLRALDAAVVKARKIAHQG